MRTADAFHELGAALSAGLIERVSSRTLAEPVWEMLENDALVERMVAAGKTLVDGKGLTRVVDIVKNASILTDASKELQYVR